MLLGLGSVLFILCNCLAVTLIGVLVMGMAFKENWHNSKCGSREHQAGQSANCLDFRIVWSLFSVLDGLLGRYSKQHRITR